MASAHEGPEKDEPEKALTQSNMTSGGKSNFIGPIAAYTYVSVGLLALQWKIGYSTSYVCLAETSINLIFNATSTASLLSFVLYIV